MAAYQYLVEGRVQGVGYRYFAMKAAEGLGVSGFARNLADGRVEVIAEGTDAALEAFEARLREGPGFAHVQAVVRAPVPARGASGFHVR
jgi:acylphosphatase